MSLSEFLEAHIKNGSRSRNDWSQVPVFYHPAETPSGPDIVFVLHFDNYGFCPIFIQLKRQVSLKSGDILGVFATCILLKIDKNNICDLFPEAHVKVLDRLKNIKRELEQSRDDPADDRAVKQRRF
ncbi:hypothetical protein BG015_011443 [Linnemannia schmuckeri]|uniref:Uncharacterized protein n=1 Tax=Linnemannia schmuckeri TaxID=64567 RepID=A0A9P5V8C4_9FUNG|nr:hypothetical protein BG015_011443 [Linnemannia schmuckeri]